MDSINIQKDSISSQLKDSVSISKDSIDSAGSFSSKEDWQAIAVVEAIVIVIAIIVIFILTRIRKGNSQNKSKVTDTSVGNSYNTTALGHNIDNTGKQQNKENKKSEGMLTSKVPNSEQQDVSTKETTDTTQKTATKENSGPISPSKETNSSTETKLKSPAATQSVPSKKPPTTLPPTIKTLYAPYPRSSNDGITYFADLIENYNEEDSRFELMVFDNGTKAEFLPLNFIDIRNSDDAMSVINTEGEKPNHATTVVGKTHGKAHKDGEMWIVDEPAKLKLK